MTITLTVHNSDALPAGRPASFQATQRNIEVGREGRDWALPDPNMLISGRHCEIRYEHGGYWLHDHSRNGTFLNGSERRLTKPHRLENGDRLRIGHYVIAVGIGAPSAPDAGRAPQVAQSPFPPAAEPILPRPVAHEAEPKPAPSGRERDRSGQGFGFEDSFAAPAEQRRIEEPLPSPPLSQPQATAPTSAAGGDAILRAIALGAGVSPEIFLQRDSSDVAAEIGLVLRTVVDELALLLRARAAAKALSGNSNRTMVSAVDNNPLKFVPRSEEALEIMFTRKRAGYLDAKQSLDGAFRDLKAHEFATYQAMQKALARLLEELAPDAIEAQLPASAFTSRKSRAWDAFVATWEAMESGHENGLLDVFLGYFSDAYAKASKPK